MNIQERIEALETEFAEKIKALKAEAQQVDEFPQFGDDYWYIDSDTEVMDTASYDGEYDQGRLSIGNIFKTKEQAEFAVEKLKVEAELRKYSKPFEIYGTNYHLYFAKDDGFMGIGYVTTSLIQGAIYFESEETAREAIRAVGKERIKKYIFRAEE
ncbi:hypothetical protein MHY86_03520 [Aerococcus urinaeequi]|uniref:hypothetical protein n=1 Tax=Aerococcus urinaeequi TaxID=51665 RepID=UPI00227E4871|nr:hypothetical protein [Aerococcus urinaeequi]MCY7730790.1 hypothetical protein [Aerococcus urinaeequi]